MAKKELPIALFFYVGNLPQADAEKVVTYYTRGGYRTYFRRDVAGQKDIVENHVKIVGGGVGVLPQRYIDAFGTDTTRILDYTPLADILGDDELTPPDVTEPPAGQQSVEVPEPEQLGAPPPAPPSPPSGS